ncbi:S8/S53 family peptidase [Methylobacterium sp. ap11]|uniref:S8/S53 family peptidase n=1 Tax=Methylobacterium sp. ap11 TaxID=1761799 RepID=UPI000B84BCF9|nr:S8/S53 family peptidase [Methylobacterium sp. ap11]
MAERSVILVLPAQESLRSPAIEMMMTGRGRITRRIEGIPKRTELDTTFAPVPLGQIGFTASLAMASPAAAPRFAVRAVMDETGDPVTSTADGAQVFSDPTISHFLAPGCAAGPIGDRSHVASLLGVAGLAAKNLDGAGVAMAVMDTGINLAHLRSRGLNPTLDATLTWSPGTGMPGQYAVEHGTMCAYDALLAAPRATLLDFPILLSTTPGGSPTAGLLSDALQAYATLVAVMRRSAEDRPFQHLVVTNSWGLYDPNWDFPVGHPGRYIDNPNHPFNIVVGTLSRTGADILFAAGNCGAECPDGRCGGVKHTIMGANAHPDVMTIAGVTTKRQRVGYSSQGPGIPGMAHTKPDLSCYTHFLGSEAFGTGTPDTGTSAACPVAAGAVAAIRTKVPHTTLRSRDLARELRADATRRGASGGWNRNTGYGILEPLKTATRLGL